jgi:cobalt-zinc-cadmium efflux system outer membrane protein
MSILQMHSRVALLMVTAAAVVPWPGLDAQLVDHRAPARGATLQQAIAAAVNRNPDLLIAASTVDSARAERRTAAALPNPTLSGLPNTPYQYAISLPLDITPQRLYRTRAAAIGVDAAEGDRQDAVRQTKLAVAHTFFDVLLAEDRRTLAMERRDAVRQLLSADSARYRSGDVPMHNLVRSEVELARADADVARADVDVQSGRAALQGLMGVARPDTAFTAIGSLDYHAFVIPTADSLSTLALAHRPDLGAAERRVDQSRAAERWASALLFPTPVVSYVRQYTGPFDTGRYFSLGVAFDLPSLNLHSGERAKAAAGVQAADLARQRAAIQLQRDLTAVMAEFNIDRALVERYQSGLLSRIDESVNATRYAYSRGASSLLDVLDAVRAQQDARTDYYVALHDYWVSIYALNAAVGIDLLDNEK